MKKKRDAIRLLKADGWRQAAQQINITPEILSPAQARHRRHFGDATVRGHEQKRLEWLHQGAEGRTMKLKALDLFCGAGGASMGLHRAGFQIVGVDIKPMPRYPFEFHRADALTFPLEGFDFVWASPPCQGYTCLQHAPGARGAPLLIDHVRDRMPAHVPWVIENVEAAAWAMRNPITLCGSMFGLGAQGCQLQRHRLFETNFPILQPDCKHDARPVIGIYGGHARRRAASAGGRGTRDVWEGGHRAAAAAAMGIDWMTLAELSEAIPPAYAEHVGRAAMAHIIETRMAA